MTLSQDIALVSQDFTDQITLVKTKQISADELAQAQSRVTQQLNPKLNAFIYQQDVNEETQFPSLDTPLAGVSVAVKDNIDVYGMATTAGLETRRFRYPSQHAFVSEKLRLAGAHFSGKLNMHEGALGATNHNSHFGHCYNPFDVELTPGGSSGGSASSVAACMAPIALGTDTMGSVRIPAAYCGLFGYKPSRGAVSNRGSVTCSHVMDTIGPLARSARDLSLLAHILIGYDALSAQSQPVQMAASLPVTPHLLVPENLSSLGVTDDIIEDFERNLSVFAELGCEIKTFDFAHFGASQVSPSDSGYNFGAARRAGLILCEADMRVEHASDWLEHKDLFSPYLRSLLSFIDNKSPMDVINAQLVLEHAVITARQLFSMGHYLLMPTTPQRAFSMNSVVPANQADLTSFANQAGLAAVTMPMQTQHKLPAGMQLVGPQGSDMQLLQLTEHWQQHSGYHYKIPNAINALLGINE